MIAAGHRSQRTAAAGRAALSPAAIGTPLAAYGRARPGDWTAPFPSEARVVLFSPPEISSSAPAPLPAHFIPEPADVTGSCMLNLFQINEQAYWRTGSETRATSNGRTVRLVVWASDCPDCGAPFTQAHRDRGFVPTKSALRRCPACRNGPGKRVLGSCNGGSKFSSSTGRASLASAVATLA